MKKEFIKNRKGLKIAVLVEELSLQKGLVFVMHGLGGFKEQAHVQTSADAFREKGYTVVRFDTTNSVGESDGKFEDATTTNYYADLEDVIAWATTQSWYEEPFCLIGHSLGGMCVALYAEHYPQKVKALATIATVVSGALSYEAHDPKELGEWKRTGWFVQESVSRPGLIKRLKWAEMEDRLHYDLLPQADQLTMPVLLIIGEGDGLERIGFHQRLHDALPGRKEFHVIKGAGHDFRLPSHREAAKKVLQQWIDSL